MVQSAFLTARLGMSYLLNKATTQRFWRVTCVHNSPGQIPPPQEMKASQNETLLQIHTDTNHTRYSV